MNIPYTEITLTETRAKLVAIDGHEIEATRYVSGHWALLNEFSSSPSCEAHFSLRRQFIDGLNGIRP